MYTIRKIEVNDYNKDYLDLLSQLSIVNSNHITVEKFINYVHTLHDTHIIYVIEKDTRIISTMTIIIEDKIIHNMGRVMHIEDVVVDKNYRGEGLGKMLLNHAISIAEREKCYKIILNCSEENRGFYEKCDFTKKNIQMTKYIHE
jgi:glucosamine-phosphate N-acetyltransferase